MTKQTQYVAKQPDEQGIIHYTPSENAVWESLVRAQAPAVKQHMCQEFLDGLETLQLPTDRIPQCSEISKVLKKTTGWKVEPVPALIGFKRFFTMLSERTFPAASFIRNPEELEYLEEPDIFHEVYGHTPLLTHPVFADFTQMIGLAGLNANPTDHVWLARLYWMTIEFGLIRTSSGLKAYGAGLASSMEELPYAVDSHIPVRQTFDILEALRTPYKINILQPVYFVLNDFNELLSLNPAKIIRMIRQAQAMGLRPPLYDVQEVI